MDQTAGDQGIEPLSAAYTVRMEHKLAVNFCVRKGIQAGYNGKQENKAGNRVPDKGFFKIRRIALNPAELGIGTLSQFGIPGFFFFQFSPKGRIFLQHPGGYIFKNIIRKMFLLSEH